jgi:hypothetical protein
LVTVPPVADTASARGANAARRRMKRERIEDLRLRITHLRFLFSDF